MKRHFMYLVVIVGWGAKRVEYYALHGNDMWNVRESLFLFRSIVMTKNIIEYMCKRELGNV